jgi:lipopolysaccharide biosynthesis regulator YciM
VLCLLFSNFSSADDCPVKDKTASDELTKAGRMLMKNNQVSAARSCFLKAVNQSPKYVPALLELGTLESKSKDYDDAVKHFSSALQV